MLLVMDYYALETGSGGGVQSDHHVGNSAEPRCGRNWTPVPRRRAAGHKRAWHTQDTFFSSIYLTFVLEHKQELI